MDPLLSILRSATGLRLARRVRAALTRRLAAAEVSLGQRISPDERIIGGPFTGMLYPIRSIGSSMVLPKLLGSYEEELHPEIAAIIKRQYSDIVDIGCGEGYYAVGFAVRVAEARVHAFDLDPVALKATRDLAALNRVSARVTAEEGCSPQQLRELSVGQRLLIVSDCEGAEMELLHPDSLPRAKRVDMLVECHECEGDTSISDELRRRFAESHASQIIPARERNPSEYPILRGWTSGELEFALGESRPPGMRWLSLVQNSR